MFLEEVSGSGASRLSPSVVLQSPWGRRGIGSSIVQWSHSSPCVFLGPAPPPSLGAWVSFQAAWVTCLLVLP